MELRLTGIKEIDEKALSLNNIINTMSKYTNVSKYEAKLEKILEEARRNVNEQRDFSDSFSSNMRADYAIFSCSKYVQEIDRLIKEINNNDLPFYKIYELNEKIESQSKTAGVENIDDLIQSAKELLKMTKDIILYDNESKKEEITRTYQNIYNVLKLAAIYDRTELLETILDPTNSFAKEHIHSSILKDTNSSNSIDIINDRLKGINIEGLEYDPVNQEIILKIAEAENPAARRNFCEQKENNITEINKQIKKFNNKNQSVIDSYNEACLEYKKSQKEKNLNRVLNGSLLVVPALIAAAGGIIGHNSDKIKYEVTTTEYDLNKQEIISQDKHYKTEFWTDDSIIINKYEPWEKSEKGYIRTITRYTYDDKLDLSDGKIPSLNEIKKHMVRYDVMEEKADSIQHDDNKTYYIIKIPTINKGKTKVSHRTLLGLFLGSIVAFFAMLAIYTCFEDEFDKDVNNKKEKERLESTRKKLEKLKEERESYLKEIERIRNTYGIHADDIIMPESPEVDIIKTTKH